MGGGGIVAITNPPYLAKNSASRDKLYFPNTKHDDLYKLALDVMLCNCDYVAAIVPESFITQGLFHNRLYGVISLGCKMFDDTDCPVCLALFIKEDDKNTLNINGDFFMYRNNEYWGKYSDAMSGKYSGVNIPGWKFNEPKGRIGLYAIDNSSGASILFVPGDKINSTKVKSTSRGVTRIDNPSLTDDDIYAVIFTANELLREYREKTGDMLLTSFRGLRKDGRYRRRLDFSQAREILSVAINRCTENA